MGPLKNTRHERFAQELAKGHSAIDAYVLAGYARDDGNAIRVSKYPSIKKRVREIMAPALAEAEVTVKRIVDELATIAFAELEPLPDGLIRAGDKRAALVDLGKHLGMFAENVNVRWPDGIPKRASFSFGRKLSPGNGRSAPEAMDGVPKSRH